MSWRFSLRFSLWVSEVNIRALDDYTIAGSTADDTDDMESIDKSELRLK